jgi:hypothetical protein
LATHDHFTLWDYQDFEPWLQTTTAKKQLLHLVLGGELTELGEANSRISKIDIVGVFRTMPAPMSPEVQGATDCRQCPHALFHRSPASLARPRNRRSTGTLNAWIVQAQYRHLTSLSGDRRRSGRLIPSIRLAN